MFFKADFIVVCFFGYYDIFILEMFELGEIELCQVIFAVAKPHLKPEKENISNKFSGLKEK